MITDYKKIWSDLSTSNARPFVYLALGPLLLFLTLAVGLPRAESFWLPFLVVCGFFCISKERFKGFLFALFLMSAHLIFDYFTLQLTSWKLSWTLSFTFGLFISFLSLEEVRHFLSNTQEKHQEKEADLTKELHLLEGKIADEKREHALKKEALEKELKEARDEMKALLQLVDASECEAEKIYEQNETLSAESLEQHRQIESLKLQSDECVEELQKIQEEHAQVIQQSKHRLNELNRLRTEYSQMQLLFDASQEDFSKFRSVILSQRKQLQNSQSAPSESKKKPVTEKSKHLVLKTLEKDKATIREIYHQMILDHEKLLQLLSVAKANEEEHVNHLENQVIDKKKKLEQTKSELISLEREIFVIKKEMQQSGLYTDRSE